MSDLVGNPKDFLTTGLIYTVKILINARAFIQNSTYTIEGGGR